MAAPLQKFESSWQKEIERKQLKEAREHYLEKVKADYDRREKKKEDARKRGEGTWMLPSVSDRIVNDEQKVKKSKLKKQKKEKKEKKEKKKKKKKEKKGKKSKKRKKHSESDEDSSDSSNSDSEPEMEWVAKTTTTAAPTAGPKLERQDWMVDPMEAIFGGVTRDQIREQKKKESGLEEEEKKSVIEQAGQHERELNPYWRDGGKGMPQEEPGVKPAKAAKGAWSPGVAGDGGLGWIKQAYQRCQRAAQEEGRTLEDVAAERYGSLKKLEKMIAEAEKNYKKYMESQSRDRDRDRVGGRQHSDRDRDRGGDSRPDSKSIRGSGYGGGGGGGVSRRFMNPDDSNRKRNIFMKPSDEMDSPREPQRRKLPFMKPGEDEGKGGGDRGGRMPPGGGWRKRDGRESQNAVPRWKKSKPESSRQEDRRSPDRGRDRSRDRRDMSRDRGRERSGSRDRERDRSRDKIRDRSRDRKGDRSRSRSNDRKDDSRGSEDRESGSMDIGKDRSHNRSRTRSKDRHRHHSASSSSDSSSDSSKDSQSSDPQSQSESEPEPVRLLSEDELNALGARILKAEIMGNDDLATKLKTELEAARAARASSSSAAAGPADGVTGEGGRRSSAQKEGDDVVVLTRTDRAGNVRPLPAARHERGEAGGRRHKKEKVSTHGTEGHRERYFADDDKHNLQDLVKQEKMSTAEDSNMMFARLAGRSIEKTDEEHQIDDVMVQRANKKMSDARMEERDRSAAIYEHRRMQGALDNCKFCFENIPKHLIIAIGLKVILCLPAHRSMVPGHCLIIPMQHTASATAVEDDVWTEIQVFRKGLTAMFREQEEDTVFMETSMHLKHHPHMVVEVVPMPVEVGEMAPIYFKKAIQESDTEWAQNKKLIDLSAKNIRNSVPKGFPYFSVDFGLQGGFAHVIEDEQIFPAYFGRSVCGGMMDVEPNLWRKPHKEDFELQRQKVLRFAAWWKPYDWTQKLKAEKDSDSE